METKDKLIALSAVILGLVLCAVVFTIASGGMKRGRYRAPAERPARLNVVPVPAEDLMDFQLRQGQPESKIRLEDFQLPYLGRDFSPIDLLTIQTHNDRLELKPSPNATNGTSDPIYIIMTADGVGIPVFVGPDGMPITSSQNPAGR